MHRWAKQIMECVKARVDSIGLENFEGQNLDDLKDWTEIAKNIVCFDKDLSIVEAMKEAENEDNMHMIEVYEDYPERRYYDDYRYMRTGRYAPKGKGTYTGRRGYQDSHMAPEYADYEMSVNDYKSHTPDYWRDLDRRAGKLYYTESSNRPMNDSRYELAKRGYEESKMMHKDNSSESKQAKMKDLEAYLKELSEDVTKLLNDASPEERSMVKNKMQVLVQKI